MTDRDLIKKIASSAGQCASYKQLVRELGLGGGRDRRLLLELLARLTMRGELVKLGPDSRTAQWQVPQTDSAAATKSQARARNGATLSQRSLQDAVSGKLDLHRDGYGFVRPSNGKGREDDIFIPPPMLGGAMQGDQVMVELDRSSSSGRKSGRVLRVLTRKNATMVGIFHYGSERKAMRRRRHQHPESRRPQTSFEERYAVPPGFHWVSPLDDRMTQPVLIAFGDEVPADDVAQHRTIGDYLPGSGSASDEPVGHTPVSREAVSDARISDARILPADSELDLDGLAVEVEITDFPTTTRPARGRVLEVLGEQDAFGVDVEIVIRKHHLPHVFPAAVLDEAKQSAQFAVDPEAGREDFRDMPIVTIDGETARDFDDAVLVRDIGSGITELQVHIADVSYYVRPGTALDLEARLRGTSVYFPDRAVPMLPHDLSSGACSLRPNEDRYVLSAILHFDQDCNRVGYRITKGILRSAARMTYTQVHAIIDAGVPEHAATRQQFAELVPQFDHMYSFARRLNRMRQQRGSIDFDLPEPQIQFDELGAMQGIVKAERNWANRLIEEFMLAANECVAEHLALSGWPAMYRIHERPEPAKIMEFEEAAAAFGHSRGVGNIPVKKFAMKNDRRDNARRVERGRDARPVRGHEVAQLINLSPKMYQKLAAKIHGTPEERILSYLMLRSLKQARYSEHNEGHFALATAHYTHFTSPIRRYPDLIVHRVLTALMESQNTANEQHQLANPNLSFRPQRSGLEKSAVAVRALFSLEEIAAIAQESSEAERRADDAERELIEWKKIRFMQDRVGEEFDAIVLSVTKYGMFVELENLFLEGLVPLQSLQDLGERFFYREQSRQLVGEDSGRRFQIGDRVRVLLDKINRMERRLIFAVLDGGEIATEKPAGFRKPEKAFKQGHAFAPTRSGKKKPKNRKDKDKGKRKKR